MRQELKEVRPKFDNLNDQIMLGENLANDISKAIQSGLDVTGFLSVPWNRTKEVLGMMPEEEQKVLTRIRLSFAQFVREYGGTAFTDTERAVFGPIMPEESVDEFTNLNRIREVLDIYRDKKNRLLTYHPALGSMGSGALGQSQPPPQTPAQDQFQVGQTMQKNGKTYVYEGNGIWDER